MNETEKLLADLKLLESAPATPENALAHAEALWELGRFRDAIPKFHARAMMGGAAEEVYYAFWKIGESLLKLGQSFDEIAGALFRAYIYRPSRFEALATLCQLLRNNKRFDESYRLSMIHAQRPRDTFRVDYNAEWRVLEEHALAALHLEHEDEAREYFDLVSEYKLPEDDRERIEENLRITKGEPAPDEDSGYKVDITRIFPMQLAITPPEETARRQEVARAEKLAAQLPTAANYLNLSLAYYQAGQPQKCVDAARSALELQPDYALAYNNISAAYIRMSEWEPAITAANEALRLNPELQVAKNNLKVASEQKSIRMK